MALAIIGIPTALVGAIVGGIAQVANRWLRERKEAQGAARVVLAALREALVKTHEPYLHPVRPVVIPFAAYTVVWESERKALARMMAVDDFGTIDKAFAALSELQKAEELGEDLREEVFDGLWSAGQLCEKARRIAWRQTQSARDRARRWASLQVHRVRQHHEFWKMDRAAAKIRRSRMSIST